MCGIVGFVNHHAKKGVVRNKSELNKMFANMLWADQLRGGDSTGAMALDRDLNTLVYKTAGAFQAFNKLTEANRILSWVDANFFTVGHNRSATKGKVTDENAHPFQEGNIILVHNGTLWDWPDEYGHKETDKDVDSKAIAKMVNTLGWKKTVNEISGAYACVWIDKKDNSLNIARNNDRPLGYVETSEGLVIASENYLGAWCASRHNIQVNKIASFEPFIHYKILYEDPKVIIEEKFTPKVKKWSGYSTGISDIEDWWEGVHSAGGTAIPNTSPPKTPSTNHTDLKPTTKKNIKKDKFSDVKQTKDALYVVGDEVSIQLTGYKSTQRSAFYQFEGTICEPAGKEIRHKVIGNTALPVSTLTDLDRVYTGKISAIGKTKTGFYLINIRDLVQVKKTDTSLVKTLPEPTPMLPAVIPPIDVQADEAPSARGSVQVPTKKLETSERITREAQPTNTSGRELAATLRVKDVSLCDGCQIHYPGEEFETMTRYRKQGGFQLIQLVKVCKSCSEAIENDPKLFDLAWNKKVERLQNRGSNINQEVSSNAQ